METTVATYVDLEVHVGNLPQLVLCSVTDANVALVVAAVVAQPLVLVREEQLALGDARGEEASRE